MVLNQKIPTDYSEENDTTQARKVGLCRVLCAWIAVRGGHCRANKLCDLRMKLIKWERGSIMLS